ncbi:pilus assembly protein [Terasakiella sp. A23]|uniref:TadE/TadG family type IV pilus assembly protein n=1 Tax=Terasakiella sp. FCG-A23 TaxID=3080561 RepID=UPI00295395DD|nr:pilus assembly protein [Terasakiella sp. A23]MDV7340382.1 pilus assembly protein [Terasakiella sp. A23]
MSIWHRCKSLKQDEKGVAAIEAALYFPMLALAIMAVAEMGLIMFASTLLEGSLREASRYGITGQEQEDVSREDYIRTVIDGTMIGLVDINDATIEVKTYPSFADIETGEPFIDGNGNSSYDDGETYTDVNDNGQWDEDMGVDGAGGSGDVVRYTVSINWEVMSPLMEPFFAKNDGVFPLRASMTVRNEPWED